MSKTVKRSCSEMVRTAKSFRLPHGEQNSLIEQFFESLDTPVSLACSMLFKYGEMDQLVCKEIKPNDYNCPQAFRKDFAAISFLRKSEFVKTNIDKRQVAIDGFKAAELQCKETNHRFRHLASDPSFLGRNASLLWSMTRKIARILGDVSFEELICSGSFGPGVSTGITGEDTSSVRKFREERQITGSLYRLVGPYLTAMYPLWYRDGALSEVEFREFSKVITVPKNAKTDRTIAVEPGLNIWFQKAIGQSIRRRLRRNGLNLDGERKVLRNFRDGSFTVFKQHSMESSADRNKRLARVGSKDQTLATVDFQSASDTISDMLVREVLPPDWYTLLDSARCRYYKLAKDDITRFEKFSSMGNGFTFELESLLFYAAALACCEYCNCDLGDVSVFGDDVIIPTQAFETYTEFCKYLGFTTNLRKSFSSSSVFRESCGAYWFSGVDVTPFFLKRSLSTVFKLYGFINSVTSLAACINYRHEMFRPLYELAISFIPSHLRVFGDKVGGGGCIWSNFDQATPTRLRDQLEGYSFRCFAFPAAMLETDSPALLVARLHSSSDWLGNSYPVRSRVKVRFARTSVQQWYNFGPWSSGPW